MSSTPFLQIDVISKSFGGVKALEGVSFEISSGEVHALIGENGAGKSTLIKILSGYYRSDTGHISVAGSKLHAGSVAASEAAGIAVIHQESTAFPHLSAEDNIFVGSEPRRCLGLLLDRPLIRKRTKELIEQLGERIDCTKPVGELPVAQRQMVGMARALAKKSRLLILDEPTASLSARETEVLFRIIRQLKAEGVSIIYVSHRLEEIFELADRVTVLRDGRKVDTLPIDQIDREGLIKLMVGREIDATFTNTCDSSEPGEVLLEVKKLTRDGAFDDISFSVHAGEIVGFAGLVGAGRSEVARAIFGVDQPDSGSILIGGAHLRPGSVRAAMDMGVALVPEDRQHEGLVLPMSVSENICMAVQGSMVKNGLTSTAKESALVQSTIKALLVKAPSAHAPADSLSGGNQQKLVIGKWLARSPKVLILDEPTRGVDVGAKTEVHNLIRKLASEGMAVLVISSDLPEILSMSDRVIVMRSGSIAGELSRAEASQEKILELALSSDGVGERQRV